MLHSIINFFASLGLPGIFFSVLIENVGIPFPTEAFYILSQHLISSGAKSYFLINVILTLGHMSGAIIAYFIGRSGESLLMQKLKKNRGFTETHKKVEQWYKKYGNITIFLTRMTGYVRPWSSLVAGFAGVKFKTFFMWSLLGTIIFNIITLYISNILLSLWQQFSSYQYVLIVISVLIFLVIFVYYPISIYKRYSKKN